MFWIFVYNYVYEQTFSFLINNIREWLDHIEGVHVSFLETDELSQKKPHHITFPLGANENAHSPYVCQCLVWSVFLILAHLIGI